MEKIVFDIFDWKKSIFGLHWKKSSIWRCIGRKVVLGLYWKKNSIGRELVFGLFIGRKVVFGVVLGEK